MALDDILAAMEAKAEAEIKQITAHAEHQVATIKQAAEQQALAIRARALAEQHAPIERERARQLNRARREALNAEGRAREQLYTAALEQAQERLRALRQEPRYPAVLRSLLVEALSAIDGRVVLRADPRDRALLDELMPGATIEWSLETAGGVEARSADGRIVVSNTLEARLAQAQGMARQAVMPLFERS